MSGRLYYNLPFRADRLNVGPFHFRDDYGEGASAGVRIDASGAGIYNVLRPIYPLPINDGLNINLQARVRSRLVLDNDKQGFALQARAIKWDGGDTVSQVWDLNPDVNTELWYGRQDPGFVFVTAAVNVPRNVGATHLLIEPMVHAASGYCDLTSVRLRTYYYDVFDHESPGESAEFVNGNFVFNRFLYGRAIDVYKNQVMQLTTEMEFEVEYNSGYGAGLFVKLYKLDNSYDERMLHATSLLPGDVKPIGGTREIIADDNYNYIDYVARTVKPGGTPPQGQFFIRDQKYNLQLKDIVRSGA